jgi:hypothetical protein
MNKKQPHMAIKENKAKGLPPRVLWVSNAPWAATGYGQQTAQVVPRLKADGIEIAIAANYGQEASTQNWATNAGDVKVYPRGWESWSNDVISAHMLNWHSKQPDADALIMTLFDTWVFKGQKWSDWKVASWTPIDHYPIPPDVLAWSKQSFVKPIAMSKFGKSLFDNLGVESFYVPHAIEKVFKRTEKTIYQGQEVNSRDLLNISSDKFVVGMNAGNKGVAPNRKAFGENLLAFSVFAKKHDDVVLYLHTDPHGGMGGINLLQLIQAVELPPEKVVFVDSYTLRTGFTQELMACMYSGLDVLLATSYGEGFGIPIIEAQSCGVPVIASNFAASAELVGDGWLVDGQALWDAMQKSWFHIPSVPHIIDSLEQAYNRGRKVSDKAIKFAQAYDADLIYKTNWKPTLKAILKN